ncbi:hypothetical protein OTU49_014552, partial [Cherax quadricarinatus]
KTFVNTGQIPVKDHSHKYTLCHNNNCPYIVSQHIVCTFLIQVTPKFLPQTRILLYIFSTSVFHMPNLTSGSTVFPSRNQVEQYCGSLQEPSPAVLWLHPGPKLSSTVVPSRNQVQQYCGYTQDPS